MFDVDFGEFDFGNAAMLHDDFGSMVYGDDAHDYDINEFGAAINDLFGDTEKYRETLQNAYNKIFHKNKPEDVCKNGDNLGYEDKYYDTPNTDIESVMGILAENIKMKEQGVKIVEQSDTESGMGLIEEQSDTESGMGLIEEQSDNEPDSGASSRNTLFKVLSAGVAVALVGTFCMLIKSVLKSTE